MEKSPQYSPSVFSVAKSLFARECDTVMLPGLCQGASVPSLDISAISRQEQAPSPADFKGDLETGAPFAFRQKS